VRRRLVACALLVAGCAQPVKGGLPDAGRSDGGARDLAARDSGAHDLATSSGDLATAPADLATGASDLASLVDAALAADLASVADLARASDSKCTDPSPCDPVAQSCCAGEKCTANGNSPACVSSGAVPPGGDCTTSVNNVDDCSAGAICIAKGSGTDQCAQICRDGGNNHQGTCPADERCVLTLGVAGLSVCSDPVMPCDAVFDSGCPNAQGCFLVSPLTGETGCHAEGGGAVGANCKGDYDCIGGFLCVGGNCKQLCQSSADCLVACAQLQVNGVPVPNSWGVCDPI
jgi:hypothetical protein